MTNRNVPKSEVSLVNSFRKYVGQGIFLQTFRRFDRNGDTLDLNSQKSIVGTLEGYTYEPNTGAFVVFLRHEQVRINFQYETIELNDIHSQK